MPFIVCFSKLRSKSKANNKDYEAIPYEQKSKPKQLLPSPVRIQVEQNRARLDHLNKLKKRNLFNELPDFHSTRLDISKVTSTMINNKQSPPSLNFDSDDSTCSRSVFSNSSDYSSDFEQTEYYTNSSCASDAFQDVNTSFFGKDDYQSDMVYVCVQSYQPQFEGDIILQYSERVNVLHATEEFSLVKKISSQECGYVPSSCLTSFSSFIRSVC